MPDTQKNETGFNLEMPKVGIIKGVLAKDIEITGDKSVNLRTCARPYRNIYSTAQLRTIKHVIETYGSGKVHLSPRHNLEIPEVGQKHIDTALKELYIAGLFPGGAGASVRNVFTCPDWCAQAIKPVQEIGQMVSKSFGDADMPNKVTISFAGCANGCSRPLNTDIGIVAVGEVKVAGACPEGCTECLDSCPFDALELQDGQISLNENCVQCAKCARACPHGVLNIARTGFRVFVGGKEGSTVRFGRQYADFAGDFEILEIVERVLTNYKEKAQLREGSAKKKERIAEVVERMGLDAFMNA
jgi:anaerobic sulfite reductase subunit C